MGWAATGVAPLLEVQGVTLQYKTREHLVTATYRVDFSVIRSDRFALLGPSGWQVDAAEGGWWIYATHRGRDSAQGPTGHAARP